MAVSQVSEAKVSIRPLSECLGAEVTGVNLSQPVSSEDVAAIEDALTEHLMVVIRDQKLDPRQYLATTRLFGETMEQHMTDFLMKEHPEIVVLDSRKASVDANGEAKPVGSRDWHTDHTNHAEPPKVTALYAVTLPKSGGGDTGFANMHAALKALPQDMQNKLAKLKTVNKLENYGYIGDEHRAKFGDSQIHPLVRTHPVTGKKAIYIHPGKTESFVGMSREESHALIDDMMDRIITPATTYRHKWQPGDLVLWDNRALLHIAHTDYDFSEGRVMHRVLLKGDAPY